MYITRLRLENVKLLADQDFSFVRKDGTIRHWTVLVGDNGVCKTTVLQALAIVTSGDRMTRALVADAADYVDARDPGRAAKLTADIDVGRDWPHPVGREVEMSVPPGSHAFQGAKQAGYFDNVRDRREPGHFVVGYGIGRRLPRKGEVPTPRDPAKTRVESLFDSQQVMLGVDFFEVLKETGGHLEFVAQLRDVLLTEDADGNKLLPWLANLELRGQGGVNTMTKLLESRRVMLEIDGAKFQLAPHQLSQGYQSMFAWIADLIGHAFLDAGVAVSLRELEGVVLLDEIDLHLHPTWQRRVVPILRKVFPRLQFVVTTHSPLVLTGFEADEIIRLELLDDHVVQATFDREPGMQSGTELMGSYFDVPTAARPELVVKQERMAELQALEARTAEQEAELLLTGAELLPYLESTELADLQAPDAITADSAPADLGRLREELRAIKARAKAPLGLGEEDEA